MTTEIMINNLSAIVQGTTRFSDTANAFLSEGYVSAANNTYFNALRFAEGIIIKEDVGQGYAHTFLNGLRIYSLKDRVLLADRTYNCCYYSKQTVRNEVQDMLQKLLEQAAHRIENRINSHEVTKVITRILNEAFESNQMQLAQNQMKSLL